MNSHSSNGPPPDEAKPPAPPRAPQAAANARLRAVYDRYMSRCAHCGAKSHGFACPRTGDSRRGFWADAAHALSCPGCPDCKPIGWSACEAEAQAAAREEYVTQCVRYRESMNGTDSPLVVLVGKDATDYLSYVGTMKLTR